MPYSAMYDAETECLMCRITGDIDPSLMEAITNEAVSLQKKHGYKRVLHDLREANVTLSTLDLYFLPRRIEAAGLGRRVKRALVVSGEAKDATFFETASVNLGHQVRIFGDPEQAKHWLLKES
jgi:hypothetical protein